MAKIGVLLVNLGTPDGPTPDKVRPYLKQFLMDPYVIDIPYPLRWFLVNIVILNTRPKNSSEAYHKIWTDRGSPLLFHTLDLGEKVQRYLGEDFVVKSAMRYGSPSIESILSEMVRKDFDEILMMPLYPQYSLAATESCVAEFKRVMRKAASKIPFRIAPAFYDNDHFIQSFFQVAHEVLSQQKVDHVVFSFHGVPERHVKKTERTKNFCLSGPTCCDKIVEGNKDCYRAQCFATSRALAKKLNLGEDQYSTSFQSRLGRTPWIKPYTDFRYKELADAGKKRIAVLCPSFVADCLETIEEINIRGRKDFISAGGEDLIFVPSLNSTDHWVRAVSEIVKSSLEAS